MIESLSDVGLLVLLAVLVSLVCSALLGLFGRIRLNRTLWDSTTYVVQYETPKFLTPAEFGWLFDRYAQNNEIKATVLSLCQEHILAFDGSTGYVCLGAKSSQDVDNMEAVVLSVLKNKNGEMELDSLVSFVAAKKDIEHQIIRQLQSKDYLTESDVNLLNVYTHKITIALTSLAITGFYLLLRNFIHDNALSFSDAAYFVDSMLSSVFLIPVFVINVFAVLVIINVDLYIFRKARGTTIRFRSEHGALWRDVYGLHKYLSEVEGPQMGEEAGLALKNKLFPYAIAIGASKI